APMIYLLRYAGAGCELRLQVLSVLKLRALRELPLQAVRLRERQELVLNMRRHTAARVRQFAATLFRPEEVGEYFVCGPGDMIEQVSATLHALGVPAARVHAEHFTVAATAGDAARHGAQAPARAARAPAAGRRAGAAEGTMRMPV